MQRKERMGKKTNANALKIDSKKNQMTESGHA